MKTDMHTDDMKTRAIHSYGDDLEIKLDQLIDMLG